MNVKAALTIYKAIETRVKAYRSSLTPEEWALRTIVSAYLKQRLVIKQLQKHNRQLQKGVDQWNSFRNSL